jgi:hypothetical protein
MNKIGFMESRRWQDGKNSLKMGSKGRCTIKLCSVHEPGRWLKKETT